MYTSIVIQRHECYVCLLVLKSKFHSVLEIKLQFKGEGRVHWTERESRTNSKNETENYNVNYHASEEYLNYTILLQGDEGISPYYTLWQYK